MLKELAAEGQMAQLMSPQQFGVLVNQERSKWIPSVTASSATATD